MATASTPRHQRRASRRLTEEATYRHLIKLVLVGDSGVGKTNLLSRFTNGKFDEKQQSTIGVEFASKIVTVMGNLVKAQM